MLLLILTVHVSRAQEIRLEDLADGPGLLPFNIGDMKLTTQTHTFLQYIELTDIESSINIVRDQLKEARDRLTNDTYFLFETQIQYLVGKLDKASDQLRSLEPSRGKRGLVDGLGSVIKSLTGNLDHSDALRYNDAIRTLRGNQDRIVAELNDHISLSKEWMNHHMGIVSQIIDNQAKINETLLLIINGNIQAETSLIIYAKFAQLLVIINDNLDELVKELYRIEDILAFTRTRSTHHSMLSIRVLSSMLDRLKNLYDKEQVLDLELREYYNIIRTGSYFIQKRIVIIFRFPIISPHNYNLYKLPILPNKDNQIIVPPYPLIATDGDSYVYIEAECPKIKAWYLCETDINHQIRTQPDCIHHLIEKQSMDSSCKQTIISLAKPTMQKLDDRSYVLIFPQPAKVHLICGREDYNTLNGSYLATIPKNCMLRTENFTIINTEDRVEGRPLKIMKITGRTKINLSKPQPAIALNTVNLKDLQDIQNRISLQPPLQLTPPTDTTVYHTTIPFYIVMLGTVGLIIVIKRNFIASCYKKKGAVAETSNSTAPTTENSPPSMKSSADSHLPATFSLNILK